MEQFNGVVVVCATRMAEYERAEYAAEQLAKCLGTQVAAEELDGDCKSFTMSKLPWNTCVEVREHWQVIKNQLKGKNGK